MIDVKLIQPETETKPAEYECTVSPDMFHKTERKFKLVVGLEEIS